MKASKITRLIEKEAPLNLAEKWDNVGYQIGSRKRDINKILLTLDITDQTIEEAILKNIDMIISHHPFFFSNIKAIDLEDYKGKLIEKILKNDITIYSAHTNLDKAANGINEYIAKLLNLKDIKPLSIDNINHQIFKLVVYVPENDLEKIQSVLEKFKTGKIYDNYQNCTFRSEGTGTFEPVNKANPTIGQIDHIEEVKEVKLETVIFENEINPILQELKKVHPYEEMAYDLFPLKIQGYTSKEGLGRIGFTKEPVSADNFAEMVKEKLDLEYLREAGKKPREIKKVAICTGSGSEFIIPAKRKGADVLITGDLKYHEGQKAYENNIWILDAGHFGTEKQVVEVFKEILKPIEDEVEIITSESTNDYIHLI